MSSMARFSFTDAPFAIRADIADAYRAYWQKLAAPGTWWRGEQRIAIARECRNALAC